MKKVFLKVVNIFCGTTSISFRQGESFGIHGSLMVLSIPTFFSLFIFSYGVQYVLKVCEKSRNKDRKACWDRGRPGNKSDAKEIK